MTATEIAKRKRAEKTAYAINSIEGVPVSEETKRLRARLQRRLTALKAFRLPMKQMKFSANGLTAKYPTIN